MAGVENKQPHVIWAEEDRQMGTSSGKQEEMWLQSEIIT